MSATGPIVHSFVEHFIQRWNFVKQQRYECNEKYTKLGPNFGLIKSHVMDQISPLAQRVQQRLHLGSTTPTDKPPASPKTKASGVNAQLCRSATKWSQGVEHEKSIQNAYIDLITHASHFIYIENQFFSILLSNWPILMYSNCNRRQTGAHKKSDWQGFTG
jgi:phospholipase D1/2